MTRRDPSEVGRLVCQGRWKKKHLLAAREQFGSEYLADALLSVFTRGDPVEGALPDQAKAGGFLVALRPIPSKTLLELLKVTLPKWNLSAEELPIYLSKVFGRDNVLETLKALEADGNLTAHAVRGIQTFRFWLAARKLETDGD